MLKEVRNQQRNLAEVFYDYQKSWNGKRWLDDQSIQVDGNTRESNKCYH